MNGLKENINNNNMNRAVIIIAVIMSALILSVACDSKKPSDKPTAYSVTPTMSVTEVAIDGCEYLYYTGTYVVVLTHKGNCTNHKSK